MRARQLGELLLCGVTAMVLARWLTASDRPGFVLAQGGSHMVLVDRRAGDPPLVVKIQSGVSGCPQYLARQGQAKHEGCVIATSYLGWIEQLGPMLSTSEPDHAGHKLCLTLSNAGKNYYVCDGSLTTKQSKVLLDVCANFPNLITPY